MSNLVLLLAIAIAAGIAVALQGQFMAVMDRAAGTATSVLITYGVGGIGAIGLWLARGGSFSGVRQVPWYSWFAGALGLIIVGGMGFVSPRLGLSRTIIVTIAVQLLAALAIDHFGAFGATPRPVDLSRALGCLLAVAGAWLIVRA